MYHPRHALIVLLLVALSLSVRADFFTQCTAEYDPDLTAYDQFGISGVKVTHDGTMVVAAAPYALTPSLEFSGQGVGYLYQFTDYQWNQASQFVSNSSPYAYGNGFDIAKQAGFTALFGELPDPLGLRESEADFWDIYIYGNDYTDISQQVSDPSNTVGTGFGSVVALSGLATVAVIGAPNDSANNGSAYIYHISNSGWMLGATLTDPNGITANEFGSAVAVSEDGSAVLVGTNAGGGTVYLYTLVNGIWTQTLEFDNVVICQGCMALSSDGQSVVIATTGGVTVYSANDNPAWSGTPIAIADPSGPVDMSADGQDVLIGTFDRKVFLYALNSGTWNQVQEFDDPSSDTTDGYGGLGSGSSVALSDDNETAVISAGTATVSGVPEAGAIYIYQSTSDLSLSVNGYQPQVALNDQVGFDITVTNNDTNVTAYNVTFTYTIPPGLTFTGSGTMYGTCDVNGTAITCTTPSLAPGGTWQSSVQVQVSMAGAYTNTFAVTSNQPDQDTSNNTVSVDISMLPPTVSNGSVTTTENVPVSGTLNGNNPCNCGTPAFSIVTQPSHGSVSITNSATGAITFTPTPGYSGADSFTFQLANGLNTSATSSENITINPSSAGGGGGSGGGGGGGLDGLVLGLLGGLLLLTRRRTIKR
ncbi:MAG: DUF11 domain-containing protein [Gammaproteobacteria bacterium]|nr:DUF11 domain-containing protein [Gammaproteobacteria bacterium]MDE2345862.1 DUF11 domain-containing protein [Gammaproteobacteria bacterium]